MSRHLTKMQKQALERIATRPQEMCVCGWAAGGPVIKGRKSGKTFYFILSAKGEALPTSEFDV